MNRLLVYFIFTVTVTFAQTIQICRISDVPSYAQSYSGALSNLLENISKKTTVKFNPDAKILPTFSEDIFKYPMIYVNYADRINWELSEEEEDNLRLYLERGGFMYIDAGINASFLDEKSKQGQHHSYASWEVTDKLKKAFSKIFPELAFEPLPRSHKLFKTFYTGLPDASKLPETIRPFIVNEKWPDGTYSTVGLKVKGRFAVLATPIVAMGWGVNHLGQWSSTISFRVRESSKGLNKMLNTAAYSGRRFEVLREDGRKDFVYCQSGEKPSWVEEPGNQWRVFRYYSSKEISDFAHEFYTQFGTNIFLYGVMN